MNCPCTHIGEIPRKYNRDHRAISTSRKGVLGNYRPDKLPGYSCKPLSIRATFGTPLRWWQSPKRLALRCLHDQKCKSNLPKGRFQDLAIQVKLLLFLLLFSVVAAPLTSSAITGTAVGTVTDPTGAVVPNAKGAIRSQQTNQARNASTEQPVPSRQATMNFLFRPTEHRLTVEAAGFQKAEVGQFTMSIDQVACVDVDHAARNTRSK